LAGNSPRIGFFVQAYNTAPYIGDCLDSIFRQRGSYDVEVLVIDDASTDATAMEIERFKSPRMRVIRHERNHGAMATANEGYLNVPGDFIVRVDSDDRFRPEFLEKTVPWLERDDRLGFVYGDIATMDETGRVTSTAGVVHRPGLPESGDEFLPLLMQNYVPAPTTLVRRRALDGVLPAPANLTFVDWYVTTGVAERWHVRFVPDILADYRIHSHNMHRTMILDRTGEASSAQILESRLSGAYRKSEKRAWRRRVYASHFLTYADKYFGAGMTGDARRCYRNAIRQRPSLVLDAGTARRFAATVIGRQSYDALKALVADSRGSR